MLMQVSAYAFPSLWVRYGHKLQLVLGGIIIDPAGSARFEYV